MDSQPNNDAMNEQTTSTRLAQALRLQSRRERFLVALTAVSLVVAGVVARSLMLRGIAMTHKETILDCHYMGNGAHKHNADCYDKGANLVCPLKEMEPHTHDDSCYTEEYVLVCDLPEDENHTHTDSCYELVRVLTCDKAETTEEHVHGPGCFKTVTVRDSDGQIIEVDEDGANIEGLELEDEAPDEDAETADAAQDEGAPEADDTADDATEDAEPDATADAADDADADPEPDENSAATPEEPATSGDAPADGSSGAEAPNANDSVAPADEDEPQTVEVIDVNGQAHTLIVTPDDDDEDTTAAMPAQHFEKVIKDRNLNVLVRVVVDAPEGAFPAGTTMRIMPVSTATVSDAVEKAIAGRHDGKVVSMQAVDIMFYDAAGSKIEPAKAIEVTMASDTLGSEELLAVRVDGGGTADVVSESATDQRELRFDVQ